MEIYIILAILLLLLSFISLLSIKMDKVLAVFVFFILVFFSSLRYDVGIDYMHYRDLYYNPNSSSFDNIEPLYKLFLYTLRYLNLDPQFQFIITSILIESLFTYNVFKYSKYKTFTLSMFFLLPPLYLTTFNLIRQSISVMIFLIAFRFLVNRDFIKFFSFMSLSILIHKTTVIAIASYFLLQSTVITIFSSFCIAILSENIMEYLIELKYISPIYTSDLFDKKANIIISVFIMALWSFNNLFVNKHDYYKLANNGLFFAFILSIIPVFTNLPAETLLRLTMYFTIFIPFLLDFIITKIKDYRIKFIFFLLFLGVGCTYFIYTIIFKGHTYNLVPYKTFFSLGGF